MTVDCEGRLQLSLAGITAREAGLYCCTATNAVGRAQTSCQVIVTSGTTPITANLPAILAPSVPYSKEPRFVTKPRSSEAVEGETVVINCEVVGDPQPDVMWLRDWLKLARNKENETCIVKLAFNHPYDGLSDRSDRPLKEH
ncbi:hypothetical protein J6590_031116 [Homalodisca vitripennis]|nr:hypothetical protein J6590_031116 [Homalodisca vitripennis]